MLNTFFHKDFNVNEILNRLKELEQGKVGFYSVGLYPASLAYNCAMQKDVKSLILAPRPGREVFGAFPIDTLNGMDKNHVEAVESMSFHYELNHKVQNTLADLILRCDLVILSANSNHIEEDISQACSLKEQLGRGNVVLACLAGSFSHDNSNDESYVLCEKINNLGFFSGFHRHDALRNPLDSFTANFCHPDALTAMLGARMLDKLSPNIQVSSGVHNIEGQYIKAAKNMSSIFAGFGYAYHQSNPGLLPTLLTLLLEQCLDQAATVSMHRLDRDNLYNKQPFSLTELGYGVQKIEAALVKDGDMQMVRDHTFSQLTAMVADVRGSMMMPISGKPTRNFQAGVILACKVKELKRCPNDLLEFESWCSEKGLQRGGLEGLNSIKYWPNILRKYKIPLNDSSMLNLLYISIYGNKKAKEYAYQVITQSRELTSFCQESVRPTSSRKYANALNNLSDPDAIDLLISAASNSPKKSNNKYIQQSNNINTDEPIYLKAIKSIEEIL
tara:strand:+ start:213 stop:1718 length:1506 start_codon:yes stop_codon:yes gene_type:complete